MNVDEHVFLKEYQFTRRMCSTGKFLSTVDALIWFVTRMYDEVLGKFARSNPSVAAQIAAIFVTLDTLFVIFLG